MVTMQQVKTGLVRYIDTDVLPHLTGIKKLGLGVYTALAANNVVGLIEKYREHPAVAVLDVIDADGGTRCAGICGASVAFQLALNSAFAKRNFSGQVMRESIAAVSVGIVNGEPVLDLNYAEDSQAEVDMNVVMTESGKIVEIQGTAERAPFSRAQFNELMDLAEHGLKQIFEIQRKVIAGEEPEKNESKKSELGRMSDAFSGINL